MASPETTPAPEGDSSGHERELDAFRKERDEAVEELKKTKKELASVKKMLKQMIDSAEVNEKAKAQKKDKKKRNKSASHTLGPDAVHVTASNQLLRTLTPRGRKHPLIAGKDDDIDSKEFYAIVAENHPDMKISEVLEAEKKFLQADKNHDGVVDREELDRMLIVGVTVFTPDKVEEIMKAIDQDESGTIDFLEALTVMEKLKGNKKTNLPDQVKQNRSKVCSIQ